MSSRFPKLCELSNVIPESDHADIHAILPQAAAEGFYLSTLSGAIDSGKTHQAGAVIASRCGHREAPGVHSCSANGSIWMAGAGVGECGNGPNRDCCADHNTDANQNRPSTPLLCWSDSRPSGPRGRNAGHRRGGRRSGSHGVRDTGLWLVCARQWCAALRALRLRHSGLRRFLCRSAGILLRVRDWWRHGFRNLTHLQPAKQNQASSNLPSELILSDLIL